MALNNLRRGKLEAGKTIPIILDMFPGKPVLHCEHLGDENYGFVNDMMRSASTVKVGAQGAKTVADRTRVRSANRETVAKHSVRRIEGFFYDDESGNPDPKRPVPSTPTTIAEVVDALPDDIFDMVLAVVIDAERFRDIPQEVTPEDVAKKS